VLRLGPAAEDGSTAPDRGRRADRRYGPGRRMAGGDRVRALDGLGVLATVDGREVLVGRTRLFDGRLAESLAAELAAPRRTGTTAVAVGWTGGTRLLLVADRISRPPPTPSPSCAGSGCARCCSPATTRPPPARWPRKLGHRRGDRRGAAGGQGRGWSPGCASRAEWWPWSATG